MELADIVLAPSNFVAETIRQHFNKRVVVANYGADAVFSGKNSSNDTENPFRVLFVGTASVRKGVPMLLEVWRKLGWRNAELVLVGSWQLGLPVGKYLPTGVKYLGKLSQTELTRVYTDADCLVHPSNFEGFSLSILEALGLGLPVLASTATGAADLPMSEAVRLFEPENPEQLAEALIAAKVARGKDLSGEARRIAAGCSWEKYRKAVTEAVRPLLD